MQHKVYELRSAESKIKERSELAKIIEQIKADGKNVVSTNGCFDILHVGHVRFLQAARKKGDFLVVGLNTDESVKRLKGPGRPVVTLADRVEILAGLECVDFLTVFDEETPREMLTELKPSIHVKGGDYSGELIESAAVQSVGGRVEIIPFASTDSEGRSTTNLINRILKTHNTGV